MTILGIETSCDETSVAVVKNGTQVISNVIASSQAIQSKYGGIVPEVAARKQAEYIIPVLTEALEKADIDHSNSTNQIDAIAVTIGPGLIGSLLIGVETAKVLCYTWQKPLIPINHLVGHIYSGWLDAANPKNPEFPLLALIASGGHTDLVLMENHGKLKLLGSTLDDAVGEAFDKVARIIGLDYPGGPEIEKHAQDGDPNAFEFPRPMIGSHNYNFSYSGLKTSVLYKVKEITHIQPLSLQLKNDLAASFQLAAFEPLVTKTIGAAVQHQVKSILVTGGVAANQYLKQMMFEATQKLHPTPSLHVPPINLATDNASYIAAAGYFLHDVSGLKPDMNLDSIFQLEPNPNLIVTDR